MLDKISGYIESITEGKVVFNSTESDMLLTFLEQAGMAPPVLEQDKSQSVISTYMFTSTRMWDEDFEKNKKLKEAYEKRIIAKNVREQSIKLGLKGAERREYFRNEYARYTGIKK